MKHPIFELFQLLTPRQRKHFFLLQILVVLMSFAEIIGVASIGPFMALIGNIDILQQDNFLTRLYKLSGLNNPNDFIIIAGLSSLSILALSAIISIITIWRLSIFSASVGMELGDKLFNYYMHKDWLFHTSEMSTILLKKVVSDTAVVTNMMIQPTMSINAKIILIIFISASIFAYNPLVAFVGLTIFSLTYILIYKLVRSKLKFYGTIMSQSKALRYTLISEGFGGIKDILLLGRQKSFVDRFQQTGADYSKSQSTNQTLTQVPRYVVEVIAFGSIIFLVLFLVKTYEGDLGSVLPVLAVYAMAGFKLLPAFQIIYNSMAHIKSATPAFEAMKEDLLASNSTEMTIGDTNNYEAMAPKKDIQLNDIYFTYPGKDVPALSGLNMTIPSNSVVGIVGSTGSGKSTTIDLLLGLISPDRGEVLIDGKTLKSDQIRKWQNTLGFVPQSIYLSNTTILENVAFGLPKETINLERASEAIKYAHLNELVEELPAGMNTLVGERGVQLSGGQRQRIGIARSLYHDAEVLILDEATSSLDGITEKFIMDALHDFSGNKTIIMIAHRFATIQNCDIIYFMEKGKVVEQGTYDELIDRSETFRKMAKID